MLNVGTPGTLGKEPSLAIPFAQAYHTSGRVEVQFQVDGADILARHELRSADAAARGEHTAAQELQLRAKCSQRGVTEVVTQKITHPGLHGNSR